MRTSKTITDPIYGTIPLTEVEAEIVSSRSFQRLHNVRQLGLAHLVFPSAGYSRFAHSIGASRNAGKMLEAIEANCRFSFSPDYKQAYRLAALLHDIGHYPFSHTTEHAIEEHFAQSFLQGSLLEAGKAASESVNHEQVGSIILDHDPEISRILSTSNAVDIDLVRRIFSKTDMDALFGIISSELDCDRLDYLSRTAIQTGVPFGAVDVEFIINKCVALDNGELAFDRKAAKAIDHLLIGRYYDYLQMVFHKTVEGLEWSLAECIRFALRERDSLFSKSWVEYQVKQGTWCDIDDSWLVAEFKSLSERARGSASMAVIRDHLNAILHRRPAKRVWKWESIDDRSSTSLQLNKRLAENAVDELAKRMSIDRNRFKIFVRAFKLVSLTKEDLERGRSEEELARSVKISRRGRAEFLVQDSSLLVSSLAQKRNFSVNIYYLPSDGEDKDVRDSIRTSLHKSLTV